MATFEYEALDTAGRCTRGIVSADTPRMARRELRQKKLVPIHLKPAHGRGQERHPTDGEAASGLSNTASTMAAKLVRGRTPTLSVKDISLLTRQLSTLVGASIPVEEALQTMAMQTDSDKTCKILLGVRGRVMEGYRLSDALAEEKRVFSPFYRSMVAAGELSGGLGAVLERLADHLEKSHRMRAKVMTALAYPAFLAVMAAGVIVALMTFIVPKVVDQFSSMGQQLPLLTRMIIGVSEGMRTMGPVLVVAGVLLVAVFVHLLGKPTFRRRVDGLVLKIPLIGKLTQKLQAARFARTLSTLTASGSSMMDALQAAERTLTNRVIRDAVREITTLVREGAGLSSALRRTAAFPPLLTYMVRSGENSGQLDLMLEKAADYMEGEFETFTGAALTLLEPAIIVVMGGIVTLIILSILLPILQLNSVALI